MSDRLQSVKGWCPGALRPMESGDGLIVRIRPRSSRLSLSQLAALGQAADDFGDGVLYLTSRANIQIRGIKEASHQAVLEAFARENLIDRDPRIEAVRNLMVTPEVALNHADANASLLVSALEEALASDEKLLQLPGKFGISVQAASGFDPAYASDVGFNVQSGRIVLTLAGDATGGVLFEDVASAVDGFVRVAHAFLRERERADSIRRMEDAISEGGVAPILKATGLTRVAASFGVTREPVPVGELGRSFGVGFAFGEVKQVALRRILDFMQCDGIPQIAVTPHRVVVFPCPANGRADFHELAGSIGAITDPGDIRLRIHACQGGPACSRGTVPARLDAGAVLTVLSRASFPGVIHISGCEKQCAYADEADIVAVGTEGRYEVRSRTGMGRNVSASGLPAAVAEIAVAVTP